MRVDIIHRIHAQAVADLLAPLPGIQDLTSPALNAAISSALQLMGERAGVTALEMGRFVATNPGNAREYFVSMMSQFAATAPECCKTAPAMVTIEQHGECVTYRLSDLLAQANSNG